MRGVSFHYIDVACQSRDLPPTAVKNGQVTGNPGLNLTPLLEGLPDDVTVNDESAGTRPVAYPEHSSRHHCHQQHHHLQKSIERLYPASRVSLEVCRIRATQHRAVVAIRLRYEGEKGAYRILRIVVVHMPRSRRTHPVRMKPKQHWVVSRCHTIPDL